MRILPFFMEWFIAAWTQVTTSLPTQVFLLSTFVLLTSVAILVWSQAVHLSILEPISLKEIELTHPHIPSLRVIVSIFLCCVTLLIVALNSVAHVGPFSGPYEWLYIAALFVLTAAVGILMELRWKGAREYWFPFILGTAVAYIFLMLKFIFPTGRSLLSAVLLLLLFLSAALAWWTLPASPSRRAQIVSVATLLLWILLYL